MNKPGIHYARLESSKRLQRLKEFLSDGRPHTTLEIISGAKVCAVNTAISELRRNGVLVDCRCQGRTEDGANAYAYQIVGGV